MHRHRELIQSQAALLHFQQYQQDSREIMLHIQQYRNDRSQILDLLEKKEEARSKKRYIEIMEWVVGAPTKLDHASFCNERLQYPGSGEWILKNEKFQNWKEADTPVCSILWLNGIPGAGTPTLAFLWCCYSALPCHAKST